MKFHALTMSAEEKTFVTSISNEIFITLMHPVVVSNKPRNLPKEQYHDLQLDALAEIFQNIFVMIQSALDPESLLQQYKQNTSTVTKPSRLVVLPSPFIDAILLNIDLLNAAYKNTYANQKHSAERYSIVWFIDHVVPGFQSKLMQARTRSYTEEEIEQIIAGVMHE